MSEGIRKFSDEEVTAAARAAHEMNRAWRTQLGDHSQLPWADAPDWAKDSAIAGARAIAEDPTLGPRESHRDWSEFKLADGWVYGEVKDEAKRTHPCLVPSDELPLEQRVKDVLFGVVVRAALGIDFEMTLGFAAVLAPPPGGQPGQVD